MITLDMANLEMYCITLKDSHYNLIKSIGYIPVGLGNNIKTKEFLKDDTGVNIAKKNSNYGEYTFHYWLWKNKIDHIKDNWVGFCQYRKFWINKEVNEKINDFQKFKEIILNHIPKEYDNYESIIGEQLFVNQFRLSKFIKNNLFTMIRNPVLFLNKNKRNLRFHFNMMHGKENLDKAINLLDISEKKDFELFMENSVSFNPHNMFMCKSKEKLKLYYESIFPWLERCEREFKFDLEGYGLKRIYGFLAERYMSYWFKKYTKFKTMPILFKDLSDFQ
jgi:hypothetical protein